MTNASGQASIVWLGANVGTDTLTAFVDTNDDNVRQADEPQANATIRWRETSPAGTPTVTPPAHPEGGTVAVGRQVNPQTGLTYFMVPTGTAASFPAGCMPLTISVPITVTPPASIADVQLVLRKRDGTSRTFAMSDPAPVDNTYVGTVDCVATGDLFVEYDLTEGGNTRRFTVPIGGLVLIDPQGVVYDADQYDAAVARGLTPAEARSAAAITGATVRLERREGGAFTSVFASDPGIAPNVNPQITAADGRYQWDVASGTYRVVVTKPGYETVTSAAVDIPPPVLDLHIAMRRIRPAVSVSSSAPTVRVDEVVTFAATATINGGAIASTRWDLDDDGAFDDAHGLTVEAAFSVAGTYRVSFRAIDDDGDEGRASTVVTVLSPPPGGGGTQPPPGRPSACATLTGTKLAVCRATQALPAKLAACKKLRGSRRAVCTVKARGLARCARRTGRLRTVCRRRAVATANCERKRKAARPSCRRAAARIGTRRTRRT